MYETLTWISENLDNYHFNTDRAKDLKREIELWSVLPTDEQSDKMEELLMRFHSMFANNPYIEANGFVTDARCPEVEGIYPGDITGATADAYFDEKRIKHYTMRPGAATGLRDGILNLNDNTHIRETMLKSQHDLAASVIDNSDSICAGRLEASKLAMAFILNKQHKGGKSPTLLSAIICIVFCLCTLRFVTLTVEILKVVGLDNDLGFVFSDVKLNYVLIGISLVMGLVILTNLKKISNTIVKGIYRTWYLRHFKRYERKIGSVRQNLKNRKTTLDNWFVTYKQAITESCSLLANNPFGNFRSTDKTRDILKKPGSTMLGDIAVASVPWRKYNRNGEAAVSPGVLITLIIVSSVVEYMLMN